LPGAALLVVLLALLGAGSAGADGPNAVILNAGCQTTPLAANDDDSSPQVALPFPINFFGTTYSSLFVNNNGNVTFDQELGEFTPFGLGGANTVIIAPFFADVDTEGSGSDVVRYGQIGAGSTDVNGHMAFCANWVNVGYYSGHTDKLNSFQLVLIDRSDTGTGNFDIEFNYDKVQWETGDASEGVGGIGGSPARIGYSNGTTVSFELPGSGVSGAFLDSNAVTGLIHNNVNAALQPGRYVFPVRNGVATGHSLSGHIWQNAVENPVADAWVQACPTPADTPCRIATTNTAGFYIFNNLPDSSSGGGTADHTWQLLISPPGGSELLSATLGPVSVAGQDVLDQDVVLRGPHEIPTGVSLTTPTSGTVTSGVPNTYWEDPLTLTAPGCLGGSGRATLTLADGYTQSVAFTETPAGSGTYTATFAAPYPHHGAATITFSLCDTGLSSFDLYVGPSGVVLTTAGDPVAGASVTLLRADDPAGPFAAVPDDSAIMSPGNRRNPDATDATGHFGWDVVAGFYKVRAQKDGCTAAETDVMTIPPPATSLTLRLDCGGSTTTTGTTDTTTTTTPTTTIPTTTTTTTTAAPPPPPRADVSVSMSGPGSARVDQSVTLTATVTNAGPNVSTGVTVHAPLPAGATLNAVSSSRGSCSAAGSVTCPIGTLDAGGSATVTFALTATQTGPLTASASAEGDYDPDQGNNSSSATTTILSATAPAPPPPPPTQPGTYNAVGTGTIKVNGADRPADLVFVLNPGDVVDVTNGMITIRGFDGSFGVFSGTQDGSPSSVPAQFTVSIVDGVTVLTLVGGNFSVCTAPRSVSANATPIRQLWGSAKGKFRTTGRYASATVRGTVWLVQDRCDGTFAQVVEDIVDVADFTLNTTTAVGPGQSYLAKPPAKVGSFKPPTVKSGKLVAQIKRSGLVWAGRTFKTRAAFEAWLVQRGSSWQAFKTAHPALAAALASRK
jgi:uncharacterized repeat protein (TIGR01451 family)